MGWICPSCGSENSFETEVCRACGHRVRPVHLAGERLATVRDRLRANRFDFLGRPLGERAWDWAGQASGVWNGILRYILIVEAVFAAVVLLFGGMSGLSSRLPRWQNAAAEGSRVLLDRGRMVREHLLYGWLSEEERVQAAADGLHTFTESTAARTEELALLAGEGWSAAGESAAALIPRLWAGFQPGRMADRIQESWDLALGELESGDRRTETRERAGERVAQYQETFTRRIQEIPEKVKRWFRSP